MKYFGRGFNFSQDGPGNRLVYHLSGCNMRCLWCANPEGFSCEGGKEITPSDIVTDALRARAMFFDGGGVTFTGGEATLWHDELLETLRALKRKDIHTAIETNGTSRRLGELLPYIDYLMMDFKHYDSDRLKAFTGVGCEAVMENYRMLTDTGREVHIRIPLIYGFNTSSPEGFASCLAAYDTAHCDFEFFPYHEYGKGKWTEEYKIQDGFVPKEVLGEFHRVFCEYGLKIKHT